MAFDPAVLRAEFPGLARTTHNGHRAVFFDNPGGTQVPGMVIEAVSDYYKSCCANTGGAFGTSRITDVILHEARKAMADMLSAPGPENIVFGANMTTLTFRIARSIGDTIQPGDEIVVTNLDHDGNVSPWTDLAAQGAVIRTVDIRREDCTLDLGSLARALNPGKTRLVAFTHASNAVGSVPDVAKIVRMVHDAGALAYVDAVQYAPHGPIDVVKLDCDFLACSVYKFFGPHVGVVYGKRAPLERFTPHKVRPLKDVIPYRWETGTLNHEGIAGTLAAVEYLASVGERFGDTWNDFYHAEGYEDRALSVKAGLRAAHEYEKTLAARLLDGLTSLGDATIYGITDPSRLDERVPTICFTWPRLTPRETCEHLAAQGIHCWSGNYYALRLMETLGLEGNGGAIRVGLAHYNTAEEVDTLLSVLADVPKA